MNGGGKRTWVRRAALLSVLLGLILCAGFAGGAGAQEAVLLPVALRLEGVGVIYGLAGGARNISGERLHLLGGAVDGDVTGQGAGLIDVPLGASWAGLSLFLGEVQEAELTTSYTRGTLADRPVVQQLAGRGAFALVTLKTIDRRTQSLTFRLGGGASTVQLEGFTDRSGNTIPLPEANLSDIQTTHLLVDGKWRWTDNAARPRQGFVLGATLNSQTGRTGQSDILQSAASASAYLPLFDSVTWALHATGADAHLLQRQDSYDTFDEVTEELGADCGQVADNNRRAACEALADDLARFVAASNRYGTTTPLGGSGSLRAYREGRFRAAHTRLFATEIRLRLSEALEAILFLERGYAADTVGELYEEPRNGEGIGLRYWFDKLPVRLEVAEGDEGQVWFFTAGLPW